MLEIARHPFCINPNPDLEQVAKAQRWPVYWPAGTAKHPAPRNNSLTRIGEEVALRFPLPRARRGQSSLPAAANRRATGRRHTVKRSRIRLPRWAPTTSNGTRISKISPIATSTPLLPVCPLFEPRSWRAHCVRRRWSGPTTGRSLPGHPQPGDTTRPAESRSLRVRRDFDVHDDLVQAHRAIRRWKSRRPENDSASRPAYTASSMNCLPCIALVRWSEV